MKQEEKIYPCIESTLDYKLNNFKIRLWINEDRIKDADDSIISNLKEIKAYKNKKDIIHWCSKNIPYINAVQVIGKDGRGIVAYTVSFSDDPHG